MRDTEHTNVAGVSQTNSFLNAGLNMIAYVRQVETENGKGFAIRAANGELYAVTTDYASAYGLIKQNDMEPVGLH